MKIEIAKSDLDYALSTVRTTVGNGTDITAHYLFRTTEDGVEVLSQNLRVFSGATLTCTHEGKVGDAFTVEAWRLDKWVSGASDSVLTLTFDGSGGDVIAKSGKSSIRLRSLDPSKFPFWDKLKSSATKVGSTDPAQIIKALNLTKNFVSSDDTVKPELCQVESVNGTFWATDRKAVASVKVAMEDLNLRIPSKDITPVTKFLSNETEIDIYTSDRDTAGSCVIFEKLSGHYLGVTKPTIQFPTLNLDVDKTPDCVVGLDMGELTAGISVLSASAPKGYESVTFTWDDENEKVVLSMPSIAGGEDTYPLSLANLTVNTSGFETFTIDYPYLKGIVNTFNLDTIDLGVNKLGRGGFSSFKYTDSADDDSNAYYAVIVWRT